MTRDEFVDSVRNIVEGRDKVHGKPEDTFEKIASLWTFYLHKVITRKDVACMMILFKVARLQNNMNNEDNWIDIAGYAVCGGTNEQG